jgi:hypothetical protein
VSRSGYVLTHATNIIYEHGDGEHETDDTRAAGRNGRKNECQHGKIIRRQDGCQDGLLPRKAEARMAKFEEKMATDRKENQEDLLEKAAKQEEL